MNNDKLRYIENFNLYLYNEFTCNNRCAHYIEKPIVNIKCFKNSDDELITKLIILYNKDEIEYKYEKNKIKNIIKEYFKGIRCNISFTIKPINNKIKFILNIKSI